MILFSTACFDSMRLILYAKIGRNIGNERGQAMEFIGNQINIKSVFATLTVAFLVGRINLFEGTFPAAVALITVMAAVSTVYIYLVPVMIGGMLTFSGQGLDFYGDMAAMIFCGVFFLFFHKQKFTIDQRTAVAAAAVILCSCIYYSSQDMLYLLSLQTLAKETAALIIYIRVFNTIARVLFAGQGVDQIPVEKVSAALAVFAVSLVGAVGVSQAVFALWLFLFAGICYCKGLQPALFTAAIAAVFWWCQGCRDETAFIAVFAALLTGWYTAGLLVGRYRKTALALVMFSVITFFVPEQVYGAAVSMALMTALPAQLLIRVWSTVMSKMFPEIRTEQDVQLFIIKRDLRKKREAFASLAKMYSADFDNRQVISYQFQGMARVVDRLLDDLSGHGVSAESQGMPSVPVGSASYAFEDVSGDSCLSFSFGGNKQAMIISDGMGKGSRAQAESRMVVVTLARLLEAGFDVDIAMKTVNAVLMAGQKGDMFATVDLAIINKETGRAQIFKMGAASTFVKHQGKVSALKRPAPPVGILDGVKLEYIDVKLRKGELLVMVSDGVTDCDRQDPECQWLRQRLSEIGSRDPETVAELIVNKAAEKYGIRERDDLTVMVAAI